jgi:parallel beta-helix repeat protein
MQRTPAGLPSGIPGIGDEIDGAVQHAPHWGRHAKEVEEATVRVIPPRCASVRDIPRTEERRRAMKRVVAGVLLLVAQVTTAATFTVTTSAPTGPGSLGQAVLDANANPGADTIAFAIGTGPATIAAPGNYNFFDPVLVDGTTQPGFAGTPLITLTGPGVTCMSLATNDSTIRSLAFGGCGTGVALVGDRCVVEGSRIGFDASGTADPNSIGMFVEGAEHRIGGPTAAQRNFISGNSTGIYVQDASDVVIQNNFIGVDVTGTAPIANQTGIVLDGRFIASTATSILGNVVSGNGFRGIHVLAADVTGTTIAGNHIGTNAAGDAAVPNFDGMFIESSGNTTIGGTTAAARNVISGNINMGMNFLTATGTVIQGNFIGTDATGTAALGNGNGGIGVSGGTATIGGTAAGAGNVISGNETGVTISFGASAVVEGNRIGTNAAGTAPLGNSATGVLVTNATATIGGTAAGAGNLVSANGGSGVSIGAGATGVTISRNLIGTDITGSLALGNQTGVAIAEAPGTVIGGTTGNGNVISGSSADGVVISSDGVLVTNNFIGTDVTGTVALPNRSGVSIQSGAGTRIGLAGAGNVISGNTQEGVVVGGSPFPITDLVVAGNRIGTNAAGTAAVPNLVGIDVNRVSVAIGGTSPGEGNLISGNSDRGIALTSASGNVIQGNLIGTDVTGTTALGNGTIGIMVVGDDNAIGGTAAGAANRIQFSAGPAVWVANGERNTIRGNSMASNAMGIDLASAGVNANDFGDPDGNANRLQNYPELGLAVQTATTTVVSGTLNSTPSSTFTIDLYDNSACSPTGNGEGEAHAASFSVTTDAAGDASFTFTVPQVLSIVTATATDLTGNTSEFSPCSLAAPGFLSIEDAFVVEPATGTATATFVVTLAPAVGSTVTVDYETAHGDTEAGDFTAVSGTLTFGPGVTTQTIDVEVAADALFDPEFFRVLLSNPTGGVGIVNSQAFGTIAEATVPAISVSDIVVVEGEDAILTITVSGPSENPVTIDFETVDGSAAAPGDYTAIAGTVTIPAGEVSATITIETNADGEQEPTEQFTVTLDSSLPGDDEAVVTLADAVPIPAASPATLLLLAMLLSVAAVIALRRM